MGVATLVIGSITTSMAKEGKLGQMVENTKACTLMIRCMERVSTPEQTGENMPVSGKMASNTVKVK